MGNETRWLTGASTILPMGSMRQQNHETMARLSSSVPASADVRNRNLLTVPSKLERIRWGALDPWEVAVTDEAPSRTSLVLLVEAKTTEELADTYPRG